MLESVSELSAGAHPEIALPKQIENVDYRISNLTLSGFRGIPHVDDSKPKFGISLLYKHPDTKFYVYDTKDEQKEPKILDKDYTLIDTTPRSLVILGENGSGKTSVYSAIEYIWLGTTSIARKHKLSSSPIAFYRNQKHSDKDFFISCRLVGNKKFEYPYSSKTRIEQALDLSNFFCSESDISMVECEGKSIINYFNGEIGLEELTSLDTFLSEFLSAQIEASNNLLAEIQGNPDDKDVLIGRKSKIDCTIKEINNIIDKLQNKESEIRKVFFPTAQKIISGLLEDYADDFVKPSFQANGDEKWFNGMLEWIETGKLIEPRNYFNNFRFKLYLTSIRISIAFSIMKSKKINFPLIFDDIFDSSDFSNRLKAKPYFGNIVKLYKELKISDKPLQIIFFTQDEVIAECVYRGISPNPIKNENGNRDMLPTIYGKLFLPSEVFDDDLWEIEGKNIGSAKVDNVIKEEETKIGISYDCSFYRFKNLYDVVRATQIGRNESC